MPSTFTYGAGSLTNCTSTDTAWQTWTTTTTSNQAWVWWVGTTTSTTGNWIVDTSNAAPPVPVPVKPARRLRDRLDVARRRRRARQLLRRVLTEEQWGDWERYRSVQQVGASGALYEVIDRYAYELMDGKVARKLCWHGIDNYCLEDRIGAFVLWLRTSEGNFLGSTHNNHFTEEEARRVILRRHKREAA